MTRGFFVTGTDTGVGKTTLSLGLMRAFQARGELVTAMKPVASGCQRSVSGLISEDARRLLENSSIMVSYEKVNPYAFEQPIAPHIAADTDGICIRGEVIERAFQAVAADADRVIVEGVGGWLVPIGERHTMADIAVALGLPVIMVVGIRLGCLNHALLTAGAVKSSGLRLAGWIANRVDPHCLAVDGIIATLRGWLEAPMLADVGFESDAVSLQSHAQQIDIGPLLD